MILYYNRAGWISVVAVLGNVYLIMGVLSSLGAALTLPGIAGIILTVGMAVDANVLIYERIKDELASGKGLKAAVELGFKHALSAIIDSNITTLLAGYYIDILWCRTCLWFRHYPSNRYIQFYVYRVIHHALVIRKSHR